MPGLPEYLPYMDLFISCLHFITFVSVNMSDMVVAKRWKIVNIPSRLLKLVMVF